MRNRRIETKNIQIVLYYKEAISGRCHHDSGDGVKRNRRLFFMNEIY